MYQIDPQELWGLRLLVFLEVEPQSNEYRQIILSPEQFKRVSDATVHRVIEKRGNDTVCEHRLSDEKYTLPDLKEIDYS